MRMSSPAGGEASLLLTDRVLIQLRSRPQARTLGQERDCFMWFSVAWWGCMWHGRVLCGIRGERIIRYSNIIRILEAEY